MPTIEMLDDDDEKGTMNAHAMPSQSSGGAEIGGGGEGGGKKKESVPEAGQGAGAAVGGQTGEEEVARSSGGEGEGVKGGETTGDGAADSQESHLTEAELLEIEEKLERARGLKQAGNILFSEHNYSAAALRYTEAIEEAPEKHKECAVFLNNRATCYFKMGDYDKVISDCSQALKLDADYTKCLLRRAQARHVHPTLRPLARPNLDLSFPCLKGCGRKLTEALEWMQAYETQKKVADAYDDFQRVVNLDPSNR
jgi:hypothetical protein